MKKFLVAFLICFSMVTTSMDADAAKRFGGRHRSVAMTHALAEDIRNLGYRVRENHRDLNR